MLDQLKALLSFLKLTDPDGSLSLTSITLLVVLVKVATSPTLDMASLLAFIAACAQYSGKKLINGTNLKTEAASELETLGKSVKALSERVQTLDNRTNPNNARR